MAWKSAGCRTKQGAVWDSGVVVTCVMGGIFDLLVLRSFWGHSAYLSEMAHNSKMVSCRAKRVEILDSRVVCIWGTCDTSKQKWGDFLTL